MSATAWPAWTDLAFYAQEPEAIHASMAAQRRAAPVHFYEPGGFWVLSKWEHQRFVLSSPQLFSSEYGHIISDARDPGSVIDQLPPWAQERLRAPGLTPAQQRGIIMQASLSFGMPDFRHMATLDPPRHGEVRSVFMKALRPSLVRGLRPLIAEVADEVLGAIPRGEDVDFVPFAGRIQPSIMTELIGVERAMRDQFVVWGDAHIKAVTVDPSWDAEEVARLKRHADNLRTYVGELIERRRAGGATGDDIISVVIREQRDGAPLGDEHIFPFVASFVSGGETTRIILSNVALALAEHPDQQALLRERPELIPNAIEETLRFYPINWSQCRTATQRVELDGHVIEPGDYVMLPLPSGNRDEDVWEDPDTYDITRSFDRDHLAFGHGEHACPGSLLTRTDTRVVLGRLLEHFAGWELAGAPARTVNPFVQGVSRLPLRFQ